MLQGRGEKPYKVCLLGASMDVGNMGCRALGASLIRLIVECRPDAEIYLLYGHHYPSEKDLRVGDRKIGIHVLNCRLSPKARLREHLGWIFLMAILYRLIPLKSWRDYLGRRIPWIGALSNADFVGDIRGGDSFSDIYGVARLLDSSLHDLIALWVSGQLIFLPQTYGPFHTRRARWMARMLFRRAKRVYARDKKSEGVVQGLLGPQSSSDQVRFCPDVAFCLEAIQPAKEDIEPPLVRDRIPCLIGLNVSGLLYMGGYTRDNMFGLKFDYPEFVHRLTAALLDRPGVHVLLVPHVFGEDSETDQSACREVWKSVPMDNKDRVHLITGLYDQNEIKGMIGKCDFMIASRMHACIAALSQGIPSVGVAYSRKFIGVFESAGVGDLVLDATSATLEEALQYCKDRIAQRELSANRLKDGIREIQQAIQACFKDELSE